MSNDKPAVGRPPVDTTDRAERGSSMRFLLAVADLSDEEIDRVVDAILDWQDQFVHDPLGLVDDNDSEEDDV